MTAGSSNGVDIDLLFGTPEGRRGLDDMELAPLIAASVAVLIGAVFCFVGARALRYAALACAFFDGAFGTAAILGKVLAHAEWEGVVSWTCFFLGGVFACLLVVSVDHADVLCLGGTSGLITACTCLTTFGYLLAPSHPDVVLYTLLVVFGVSFAFITLKTQPFSVIAATSWIGSNMATWGLGYFFGDYPNAAKIDDFRRVSDGQYELPRAWWAYVGGAITLFILGVCIQAHTFDFDPKPLRRNRCANGTVSELRDSMTDDCESGRSYFPAHTPSRHTPPLRSASTGSRGSRGSRGTSYVV